MVFGWLDGGSLRGFPFFCLIIMALNPQGKEPVQGFCQLSAVPVPIID